ncbi:CoA transferase [Streptomyces sp. M10(2022)]
MHRLIADAEVFVQNLAQGAAARLGLDAAALCAAHPRLVAVDISGYGADGRTHTNAPTTLTSSAWRAAVYAFSGWSPYRCGAGGGKWHRRPARCGHCGRSCRRFTLPGGSQTRMGTCTGAGEHTGALLSALGMTDEQTAALRRDGVIRDTALSGGPHRS